MTITRQAPFEVSPAGKLQKLVMGPWFWVLAMIFFFGYPVVRTLNRELPEPLPKYSKVPSFQLKDQYGNDFKLSELGGKVWIANFFFSSCPTICPKLMETMSEIQHRVRGVGQKIALVSYTVDPKVDTPSKLKSVADKYQANPYFWKLLTGEKRALEDLLVKGFKVPMGEREQMAKDLYDIAHSGKFVLVDGNANIRGYYGSSDEEIDRLMIDVGLLVNREAFKQ